ncbi:3845_t:CDS:2, partial [Racocetra persica]
FYIVTGGRPEINDYIPKCYASLMERNRIKHAIEQFQNADIKLQEVQLISKPRKLHHPKAYYNSRLLNPFALNNLREHEK